MMYNKFFKINIFTCCNGQYKNFIPLFIFSNLYYNDDSFVEIGIDNFEGTNLRLSLSYLNKLFPERFLIRKVNFDFKYEMNDGSYKSPIPNSIRFITEPKIKSDYVYISDIDIINLEKNICDIHVNHMNEKKLPFSNIIRPYKENQKYRRLTGLHFTPYENYYPIPDFKDLISKGTLVGNDEILLHELVKKRYKNIDEKNQFRPVHGIHVSPNREPTSLIINWGMNNWKKQWFEFRNSKEFMGLEPLLNDYIKEKIKIIDDFYESNNI